MTIRLWIPLLALSINALFTSAADTITAPKQGAALLKTDIMGVFAHPDDETGMAAALAYYAQGNGSVLANVYCTRGEGGGNMVGTHWGPSLGLLREAELRDCLSILGVRYCYFLDQVDWAYTESAAMTLKKWDREGALRGLVRLVRALRPEVIVTMNPTPRPGQHGHHQSAGILATEAASAAADPKQFTEQIVDEGLSPWQIRKLYYTGTGPGPKATISVTDTLATGKSPAEIAGNALANHRSQAFGNFSGAAWLRRPQVFTLIKSVLPTLAEETDLLRGLPIENPPSPFVAPDLDRPEPAPISLAFLPRPAIVRFEKWAIANRIPQMAGQLTSDVPVVAGEPNTIQLEIENRTPTPLTGVVRYAISDGWTVKPDNSVCQVSANGKTVVTAQVTPPAGELAEATVSVSGVFSGITYQTATRLHPLPKTRVSKIKAPRFSTRSEELWGALPANRVTSANLVQGKVTDSADSQAEFRLAHDSSRLYVAVEVYDETVVSNIAPNDIRGHWRTDSVELCIDPNPGSEHTLGCFKLGIFPFDTAGNVRAERDADAYQGPIEITAPKTRIQSERTATGYRLLASIPFSEIGFDPSQSGRLGFNLIVYDGDKINAAIGENINESRIAWAPQSGVQGRPEDWGRIDLD